MAETPAPTLVDADQQFGQVVTTMRAARRARVRLRVLAQLYDFDAQRYKNWSGVIWRLDLEPTAAASTSVREALGAFVAAVARVGPLRVIAALTQLTEET